MTGSRLMSQPFDVAALAAMDAASPARQLVQVKLEAIGGTVPADKNTATTPAADQKAAA